MDSNNPSHVHKMDKTYAIAELMNIGHRIVVIDYEDPITGSCYVTEEATNKHYHLVRQQIIRRSKTL